MFKWLVGFLLLTSHASAELPYQVGDAATVHNLEYLESQQTACIQKNGSVMSGTLESNNANIVFSSNSLASSQPGICFVDGTCQHTAASGLFTSSVTYTLAYSSYTRITCLKEITQTAATVSLLGSSVTYASQGSNVIISYSGGMGHGSANGEVKLCIMVNGAIYGECPTYGQSITNGGFAENFGFQIQIPATPNVATEYALVGYTTAGTGKTCAWSSGFGTGIFGVREAR